MDDLLFDRLARMLGAGGSRRDALRAVLTASPLAFLADGTDAKKPKNKGKKRKKKQKRKKNQNQNQGPGCPAGQPDLCAGACTDVKSDARHCGSCGSSCPNGEGCVNGVCTCGAGRVVCGGECVDGNCCAGASGVTCGAGDTCCNPNGCKNLQSNENHCGACGRSCAAGSSCFDGVCLCDEDHVECDGQCVPGNCCDGPSGVVCVDGETCCAPNGCKDLDTDSNNCGDCGQKSFEGESCVGGLSICPSGSIVCGGTCAAGNCCGLNGAETCAGNSTCCPPFGCVILEDNSNHCGECGNVCDGRADKCVSGSCICSSMPGEVACGFGETCHETNGCTCFSQGIADCGPCNAVCPEGTTCECSDGEVCTPANEICSCKDDQVFVDGECRDCPPPPGPGLPGNGGFLCEGDYCSCGGKCCKDPGQCFVVVNNQDEVIDEFCCDGDDQIICENQCCVSTQCGEGCARQTARYGSYRRPGR